MLSAKERVLAKIGSTATKTATAREAKQKKGSATGYVSVWNDLVMDEYGRDYCVAPTQKVAGMLKRAIGRLPNQNPAHIKLFMSYVVENWTDLGNKLFGKPQFWCEQPELPRFVKNIDRLYNEYCRKDITKVRSKPSKKSNAAEANKLSTLEAENKSLRLQLDAKEKEIAKLKSRIDLMTRD